MKTNSLCQRRSYR